MPKTRYAAAQVIPRELSRAVDDLPYWFVIGGHAVRTFCPYRPSRDVDFGVHNAKNLHSLLTHLRRSGTVEILEKKKDTIHLRYNGIDVSIFVLAMLSPHVEERCLSVNGILATKLHAILDRGTRRDFFDLYVTLQHHHLGIAQCLAAMSQVYRQPINEDLLLRALTYFDDAEKEARLPKEGPRDWTTVKDFFTERVGNLLIPPGRKLTIQANCVDLILPLKVKKPRRKKGAVTP